ncbi:protein Wnt-5 isoform X2 [Drosophila busckii]|uniref:protein Wnt-5 isoform X2 n=1 Tax=Drosophila busckii TaxID=30019 RepID=UPI001432C84F|nr:protein Wnt-5 isoform X2 [Drosophila busckii]
MTLQSNQIWQRTFLMTYVLLSAVGLDAVTNIQGVPTWICLGLKSPFIEFGMQIEQLANNSIPLNITKDEQAYMHQEGLRKLGTFIKPVDLRDSTTGFVKADLTKRLQSPSAQARRLHPIQEEMDQKQIILLDEDTDENGLPTSLTDEDRKFIVPMALKNSSPEVRWSVPAKSTTVEPNRAAFTSGSWRQSANMHLSTTTPPEPTSNIDDLKKHILFLHNMTKSDNNFESKFVKFPSLQKEKDKQAASLGPVKKPQRPVLQYAAPIAPPTRTVPFGAHTPGQKPFGGYYLHEDDTNGPSSFLQSNSGSVGAVERMKEESVTNIISRVHLLSDETSTTTSSIAWENTLSTTETSTKRTTKRPVCLRNPDSPKCVKQRQREEQQRQRERDEWFRGQSEFLRPRFEPFIQTINNTKRFAVSIEIPDSFKVYPGSPLLNEDHEQKRLSRVMRSQDLSKDKSESELDSNNYFAQGIIMTSAGVANNREFMLANVHNFSSDRNNETALNPPAYSEIINLDPDNCYKVNGFALGQKKLCALYTSVMPAISRGARAAIQDLQKWRLYML